MKLQQLAVALCLASPMATACTLGSDSGTPDPGMYWGWACPDSGGVPVDASAPLDYVATGSCGAGGPFAVSVNGCEMFGTWAALGLSDVTTTQYVGSPGLGGWMVAATEDVLDGGGPDAGQGSSLRCTAAQASGAGDLTFTCSDATTSATICRSTLTPVDAPAQ
jgi:hypothetical protein